MCWTWLHFARSDVLTAVPLRTCVFWDVTVCRRVSGFRRFEGSQFQHLQVSSSQRMSGTTHPRTQHQIPEVRNPQYQILLVPAILNCNFSSVRLEFYVGYFSLLLCESSMYSELQQWQILIQRSGIATRNCTIPIHLTYTRTCMHTLSLSLWMHSASICWCVTNIRHTPSCGCWLWLPEQQVPWQRPSDRTGRPQTVESHRPENRITAHLWTYK